MEKVGHVWHIRSLGAARQVLRARGLTTQAGFTAEHIPQGMFRHRPILISDGPLHDEQRRKVGRFFAPKIVADRYGDLMAGCAERRLGEAAAAGEFDLDELALYYAVEVTAEVVGLTASPVEAMAHRLVSFFRQPPFDLTRRDLGRTPRQWMLAARNGLVPLVRFWWSDVGPAIRSHRREPRDDVISHLVEEGYSRADILVECVTYGTAGMVTTREFITMAALHLLRDEELRTRYLAAPREERHAILHEIMRLEPVVGHLYRRVRGDIEFTDAGRAWHAAEGDLVDISVRPANTDPRAVGEDPLDLRPGRDLPRGVDASGLAFGDGAHRCPGQPLAIAETDALLVRLLPHNPRILTEPELGWDDLIAGYWLRGMRLQLDEAGPRGLPGPV